MVRKMVDRFRVRLRRHPLVVDLLWALPLLAVSILTAPGVTGPANDSMPPEPLYLVLMLGLIVPLIWRRRYPRAVFALIALVSFGQWVADIQPVPPNMAVLIGAYTVASCCSLRWGLAAAAVNEFGSILEMADEPWREPLSALVTTSVFHAGILVFGIYVRTRRAFLHSLEDRALRAERERDTEVQIAMAAERARIARELHDVIAHNVSVIVVQADGAAYAIETDVDQARKALETISTTGRLALSEMRRLLGVLREGDDAGAYTPQPGVDQLTELVEQVRDAGLPLEFTVEGTPGELPQGLQLAVFRIVQEALTNTIKHAGPGATARVRLEHHRNEVRIDVRDDGRGAASWHQMLGVDPGAGHGLAGMRERAALYGGTVSAAPAAGGGFEVAARLPVPREPETGATYSGTGAALPETGAAFPGTGGTNTRKTDIEIEEAAR